MLLLFLPAGRLNWWMGWVFIATLEGAVIFGVRYLEKVNADLADERRTAKPSVQTWDYVLTNFFSLVCIPAALITAGLDQRFGWSAPFPIGLQIFGLGLGILAAYGLFRLMAVNRYFSTYVRIQTDRDHETITDGAYRYIRHPGNLAMGIAIATIPLILGSWWAGIPTACAVFLVVIRTALEDRTLMAELPGYTTYAQQTRYRLMPGVW
jgi:protein-S-isoprenylcysteine O-methyltransferase Ste14